ncbi:MAG: hypothetical protein FWF92_05370 [Oscillospiraceae bacterium]|nr:hypothetical protein [Oscillospiraceae bacterium]
MKKTKLISHICIFMVFCMLSSMFLASCNSGGSIEDLPQNRKAVTLNIHFLVEDSTTPEAIAAVQKELNYITESRYTTRLNLIGLKRSEYEAEIARLFEAYDEEQERLAEEKAVQASLDKASKEQARKDKAAGLTQAPTKRATEPPATTELDIYGTDGRIKWPDAKNDQLDIFLITSSDMYYELAKDERLEGMDDDLTTKAKVLKEYIHPSIMMAGQFGDKTLAIPTNKIIGTATYIAVNKRLVEEYNIYAEKYNLDIKEINADPDLDEEDQLTPLSKLDLTKLKEYSHLTDYLEWAKEVHPDVARIEGPFVSLKNYEPVFPDMPDFALVSSLGAVGAGRPLVYTPQQEPTEAPTKAPTEPPTDDNGELLTEDPDTIPPTTIPVTTYKPQPIPAVTNLAPANISLANKYTHTAYVNIISLNQEYTEKGLFETSPVPAGKERAAFILTGTLEDMLANQAAEKDANGEPIYEYILYANPIATKEDLQDGMYAISVSSQIPTARCMEIITLLNTNKQFKNTFQYGILGTHYFYNDNGRIEYINNDYMINMNYTGNRFIADLMEGDNPNKWEIAKEHNLSVVNSVFLTFYLDKTKLTPVAEEVIPEIDALSQKIKQIYSNWRLPDGYEDIDDYVAGYVTPEFDAAGWSDLLAEIKAQTNPPTD